MIQQCALRLLFHGYNLSVDHSHNPSIFLLLGTLPEVEESLTIAVVQIQEEYEKQILRIQCKWRITIMKLFSFGSLENGLGMLLCSLRISRKKILKLFSFYKLLVVLEITHQTISIHPFNCRLVNQPLLWIFSKMVPFPIALFNWQPLPIN